MRFLKIMLLFGQKSTSTHRQYNESYSSWGVGAGGRRFEFNGRGGRWSGWPEASSLELREFISPVQMEDEKYQAKKQSRSNQEQELVK
jgi:hypothetical protein